MFVKWRPFCLGLSVLNDDNQNISVHKWFSMEKGNILQCSIQYSKRRHRDKNMEVSKCRTNISLFQKDTSYNEVKFSDETIQFDVTTYRQLQKYAIENS